MKRIQVASAGIILGILSFGINFIGQFSWGREWYVHASPESVLANQIFLAAVLVMYLVAAALLIASFYERLLKILERSQGTRRLLIILIGGSITSLIFAFPNLHEVTNNKQVLIFKEESLTLEKILDSQKRVKAIKLTGFVSSSLPNPVTVAVPNHRPPQLVCASSNKCHQLLLDAKEANFTIPNPSEFVPFELIFESSSINPGECHTFDEGLTLSIIDKGGLFVKNEKTNETVTHFTDRVTIHTPATVEAEEQVCGL